MKGMQTTMTFDELKFIILIFFNKFIATDWKGFKN